jgi:hypothetical protein
LVAGQNGIGQVFFIVGWGFAIWGVGLYWVTALQYTYVALKEIRGNNAPN